MVSRSTVAHVCFTAINCSYHERPNLWCCLRKKGIIGRLRARKLHAIKPIGFMGLDYLLWSLYDGGSINLATLAGNGRELKVDEYIDKYRYIIILYIYTHDIYILIYWCIHLFMYLYIYLFLLYIWYSHGSCWNLRKISPSFFRSNLSRHKSKKPMHRTKRMPRLWSKTINREMGWNPTQLYREYFIRGNVRIPTVDGWNPANQLIW